MMLGAEMDDDFWVAASTSTTETATIPRRPLVTPALPALWRRRRSLVADGDGNITTELFSTFSLNTVSVTTSSTSALRSDVEVGRPPPSPSVDDNVLGMIHASTSRNGDGLVPRFCWNVTLAGGGVAATLRNGSVEHRTASMLTSYSAEALDCLKRQHGTFYDACQRVCHTEMSFLRLTQGLDMEHFVYGRLFPVLVLLVVVANVLVALVLSQKHMITPTNVVLKYMAIADLCVGLVPLPWNFLYHTLRFYEHEERLELWWCYMYKLSMDAVPPVCHNIAMWLTVLLATQRYISIQYPILSRRLCSVRNVRVATLVITVLSILCGLPKSFDYYFDIYEGWAYTEPGRWVYSRSCLSGFTYFVKMIGSNAFFNLYFWTRVFGFILLPSILLIILNALLIRGIRQAQRRKDRLLKEKRAREAQRQKDSNATSLMLVVIVTIFLLVNLPQALFMATLCVYNTLGISNSFLEGVFPITFLLVSNMLVMATYPINFGIYCFMSSSFRDTFRMFFCRKHWRHRLTRATADGVVFSRFTVRRSDPSLQFSDIGYSARYSISDTMVIGNGIRNSTATMMPFMPLIATPSPSPPPPQALPSSFLSRNGNSVADSNVKQGKTVSGELFLRNGCAKGAISSNGGGFLTPTMGKKIPANGGLHHCPQQKRSISTNNLVQNGDSSHVAPLLLNNLSNHSLSAMLVDVHGDNGYSSQIAKNDFLTAISKERGPVKVPLYETKDGHIFDDIDPMSPMIMNGCTADIADTDERIRTADAVFL